MGLGVHDIRLFAKALKTEEVSGRCVTFGVQGVDGQYGDIVRMLKEEDYPCVPVPSEQRILDEKTQFGRSLHQDVFFRMLGYSVVDSIDYYPDESPSYVLDLNARVPDDLQSKYDLVYDGGTTEHVFDTRQVLTNVVKLLKPGGIVAHVLPMSGLVNHGFYQLSPCLFYDFYLRNRFEIVRCYVYVKGTILGNVSFFEYEPSKFLPRSFGNKIAGMLFCARKQSEHDRVHIPNQGDSQKLAQRERSNKAPAESEVMKRARSLLQHLPPIVGRLGRWGYSLLKAQGLNKRKLCRSEPLFGRRPG